MSIVTLYQTKFLYQSSTAAFFQAIHHLGIPTTRAGSCVTSDSRVVRDIFYDGNPIQERCSVVLRIAPTFLRYTVLLSH